MASLEENYSGDGTGVRETNRSSEYLAFTTDTRDRVLGDIS